MRTLRTDITNFIQGTRSGTRIVPGAGVKVDFSELSPDSDTLGLWHLHDGGCQGEGAGLQDASGHGRDLQNHGAASVEDGYQFVRPEGDYMRAAVGTFTGTQPRVTLEAWVRGWGTVGDDTSRVIARYMISTANYLAIRARRAASPVDSFIVARLVVGSFVATAMWQGTPVDVLLASALPWHVAAVLDAPTVVRLFVNGAWAATSAINVQALPPGAYVLELSDSAGSDNCSAVLDEVRLSSSARYVGVFTPHRLLASGVYTSPALDCLRTRARWADFLRTATVPPGCSITWEVRAADQLDPGGQPAGFWGTYLGDPAALPIGRYFQWRATLPAANGRLATPVIECTEAQASDRGYNIYHGTGPGPESLEYAEPFARVGPDIFLADVGPLEAGAVHWFGIRPVDARERATPTVQQEARLELDAAGDPVMPRPAGALAASARPATHGTALLRWRYRVGQGGVVPQTFRIFGDGGTGNINYAAALGEVPCRERQLWYTWTSGPLAAGVEHQLAVRAVTADDLWDEQPAVARVTPDSTPPAAVDALRAETVL